MPDPILMGVALALASIIGLLVALLVGIAFRAPVAAMGGALAVLGAMYAGAWVLGLLPQVPPREDLDRILVILLPAAAFAEVIGAFSARVGWMARIVVAALAAPVLLEGTVYVTDLSGPGTRTWSPTQTWLIYAGLGALLLATWTALNLLATRRGGRTALTCLAGAALGAGLVVMLSGYATGGQLGVPLAAGLVGPAMASLLRRGKPGSEGALGVGVVGLFALLVVGRLFAELTTLNAALVFAAPLLGWLPELLPARPRIRVPLRLGLAALPVVVAILLAQGKFGAGSAGPEAGKAGGLDDYMNFGK
jgi:hypothetical protein